MMVMIIITTTVMVLMLAGREGHDLEDYDNDELRSS